MVLQKLPSWQKKRLSRLSAGSLSLSADQRLQVGDQLSSELLMSYEAMPPLLSDDENIWLTSALKLSF